MISNIIIEFSSQAPNLVVPLPEVLAMVLVLSLATFFEYYKTALLVAYVFLVNWVFIHNNTILTMNTISIVTATSFVMLGIFTVLALYHHSLNR